MSLEREIQELRSIVTHLSSEVIRLSSEVTRLEKENKELRTRLQRYEHPKNSSNSSVSPSQDENRPRRKSIRQSSGKKPGGQAGRKGNTLKMTLSPDKIQPCMSNYCECCGENLSEVDAEFIGKRQVIDIPKVQPIVTQYNQYKKTCTCGCVNVADYPEQANAPVSYGNNIESLIGYLSTRHYLPFERLKEILNDVFNVSISVGGVHSLLSKLAAKAQPAYAAIKTRLTQSRLAVGSDETGVHINGKKHWAWTWQNDQATFITITNNRGLKSIEDNFSQGAENAVLVHDCWSSHFNTPALSHQICIAHLLRDLNYLTDRYAHKWSKVCKGLFQQALLLKGKMQPSDYLIPLQERSVIEKRLDVLLNYTLPEDDKELIAFKKRLEKYRDYIFTFLYRQEVPPDNNASERAIRNLKVKLKISGQFKSESGADNFAVLRSVIDTTIKNKQNVMGALSALALNYHTE